MPTRRSLLTALAVGVGSPGAGCLAREGLGTPENSSTTTVDGTTAATTAADGTTSPPKPTVEELDLGETAEGPTTVTVSAVRLRKIVHTIDEGTIVHPYPAGTADSQFLVADVSTAEGGDVSSLPLAVTLDDEVVADAERLGTETYRLQRDPGSSGSLAFRVTVSEPAAGAIEWRPDDDERFRWALPDALVADLARSPTFEVRRFDVPGSIDREAGFQATVEVANVGARDGRFLAAVYDQGASSFPFVGTFEFDVPVGESVTRELSGRAVRGDRSSATAILNWGIDRLEASFSLTGGSDS